MRLEELENCRGPVFDRDLEDLIEEIQYELDDLQNTR